MPQPISAHVDLVAAASLAMHRALSRVIWRNIMIAYFLEKLGQWFERAEHERRAEFLGQSADLADLERRMRYAERSGYPF
jgi:hypothetical protein